MARAAIRYAKAILDIANSNGQAATVNNDMKSIVAAVTESTELKNFLTSPVVKGDLRFRHYQKYLLLYSQKQKGYSAYF